MKCKEGKLIAERFVSVNCLWALWNKNLRHILLQNVAFLALTLVWTFRRTGMVILV